MSDAWGMMNRFDCDFVLYVQNNGYRAFDCIKSFFG